MSVLLKLTNVRGSPIALMYGRVWPELDRTGVEGM